jgi:hypothetical protein
LGFFVYFLSFLEFFPNLAQKDFQRHRNLNRLNARVKSS